jgi:multiple sugar transport system substrate-binding protein
MRTHPRGVRSTIPLRASAAAAAGALLLSACGSTPQPSTGSGASAAGGGGPVTVEMWDWDTTSVPHVVAAFNASQQDYRIKLVTPASNEAAQTNFQNLMASGGPVPCVVKGFTGLTSVVAEGWAQDITDIVKAKEAAFSSGARASAEVNGRYFGLPSGVDAQFMMVNKAVYDKVGVPVPKTWEELLAVAPKLKAAGVDSLNLPGEDPSGFINMAQQSGAEWFAIDGDRWRVNLLDEGTLRAIDFYQKLIDNDWVSNETYKDRPALYAYFDSGKLANVPLAWWSMGGYATNFKQSKGDWAAVTNPTWADTPDAGVPGRTNPSFVPKGCEHPEAALAYALFAATPDGIAASKDPESGAIAFPAQIADPSAYTEGIVPDGLFGEPKAQVGKIVVASQQKVIGKFETGPDYNAWFPELQDQWGKAVAGKQTLRQALENVQQFITSDLDGKGISYTVG